MNFAEITSVQELSIGAGILVPAGDQSAGRHPSYLFLHRTAAEYLVARHIARLPATDCFRLIDEHMWFDPDWAEVIPLLGGQLTPPLAHRLIEKLLGQAGDPFHHALLTAARVVAEREDLDSLLASEQLQAMADAVLGLIVHPAIRPMAVSVLAPATRLPRPIVDGLLGRLDDPDREIRAAVVEVLAGLDAPGVIDGLLGRLDDPDREIRAAVVEVLAGLDAPGVIDGLLGRLDDPDRKVRAAAMAAVAGRDAPDINPRLLALLDHPGTRRWPELVNTLADRRDPEVTASLLARLGAPDPGVRKAATEALAGRDAAGVADALLDRLGDTAPEVRLAAIRALALRDGIAVTNALLGRLSDPDWNVRAATVEALARRDGEAVTDALLACLDTPELYLRREAVEALARRDAPGVADRLVARLDHWDPEVRVAAVQALGKREAPETAQGLVPRLQDPDPRVRLATVRALRHWTRGAAEELAASLNDPYPEVRLAAVEATANSDAPEVTRWLMACVDDPDQGVRWRAIEVLAVRNASALLDKLAASLDGPDRHQRASAVVSLAKRGWFPSGTWVDGLDIPPSPDIGVRRSAAEALAAGDASGIADGLVGRLGDGDPGVRHAALIALADSDGPKAIAASLDCLGDPDTGIRQEAVRVLAARHELTVTNELLGRLNAPDARVRKAAAEALAGREGAVVTRALLGGLGDEDPDVRWTVVRAVALRDEAAVGEALVGRLGDREPRVRAAAAAALTDRNSPDDLLALSRQLRNLDTVALSSAYQIAARTITSLYTRLPAVSRAGVRADLAWLTAAALAPTPTASAAPAPSSAVTPKPRRRRRKREHLAAQERRSELLDRVGAPGLQWHKQAVFYQVLIQGFRDSNGDGTGDLRGLTAMLGYLQWLGIDCIWLLPIYSSPLRDGAYDISDYMSILPECGDIKDFVELIEEAHARGIRVIADIVVNHTSDQHLWFQASRSDPDGPFADFYIWSDNDKRYADARIILAGQEQSNWTYDPLRGQYYWHRFFSHEPDLNFENPKVQDAIIEVLRFWLDLGIDGLRLDGVPYLYQREGTSCENLPETHQYLKRIRSIVDSLYPNRVLLTEASKWPADAAAYFGAQATGGDECHMTLHRALTPRILMALRREQRYPISEILAQTPEIPKGCQWGILLRNYDDLTLEMATDEQRDCLYAEYGKDPQIKAKIGTRRRLAPLLDNDRDQLELIIALLLSLPGSPVMHYGDEIGMGDNIWLAHQGRNWTPMQWTADPSAGFSACDPAHLSLPLNMDQTYGYQVINVEAQLQSPASLLEWIRRMIVIRHRHPAFGSGHFEELPTSNQGVFAFIREYADPERPGLPDCVLCVNNLSRQMQAVELDLQRFRGATPVECMGGVDFPRIDERSYLLTLPRRGFYWFQISEPGN